MVDQAVWLIKLHFVLESSFDSVGLDGFSQMFLQKEAKTKRHFRHLLNAWLIYQDKHLTETGLPIASLDPRFSWQRFGCNACFNFHY